MAHTSTYLNFPGNTEAAFTRYAEIFGTAFVAPIARMSDAPLPPGASLSESDANLVMHVALPILGGHVLMGTDAVPSMGHTVAFGNHVILSLSPDTRAEADALFAALAEGGEVLQPLQDMFWGAYYGHTRDRFGVHWMINVDNAPA